MKNTPIKSSIIKPEQNLNFEKSIIDEQNKKSIYSSSYKQLSLQL
jgi:hypothetical protein